MLDVPGLDSCVNPVIVSGRYADEAVSEDRFRLLHATVFQRHLDRWMYEHPLIDDYCWDNQLNSSAAPMPEQCGYNLSSVWSEFDHAAGDPYGGCCCAGSSAG